MAGSRKQDNRASHNALLKAYLCCMSVETEKNVYCRLHFTHVRLQQRTLTSCNISPTAESPNFVKFNNKDSVFYTLTLLVPGFVSNNITHNVDYYYPFLFPSFKQGNANNGAAAAAAAPETTTDHKPQFL